MLILAALGLVSVTALNMYGGSLTLISAMIVQQVQPTDDARHHDGHHGWAVTRGCACGDRHFLTNFSNFLLLVLYLFIPWTAVNLVDYYIVRRGHYAIAEIFNPHGMYGRWGWPSPAWSASQRWSRSSRSSTLYIGPVASAFGGADISLFISACRSPILYWLFARTLDVAAGEHRREAGGGGPGRGRRLRHGVTR